MKEPLEDDSFQCDWWLLVICWQKETKKTFPMLSHWHQQPGQVGSCWFWPTIYMAIDPCCISAIWAVCDNLTILCLD